MKIKKVKNGWQYNGNFFADEASAMAALKADESPDLVWSTLNLQVPTSAVPEVLYDGQNRGTSFGAFVTTHLQKHGGSIVALARKLEVSKQTIFDWMNAKSLPSVNHGIRILEVMDCTPSTLEAALQDNFQKSKEIYFEKLKKA